MFRYAQIDDNGFVVSDSFLNGEINSPNMIAITDDFVLTNKKYVNGEWVEYTPEAPEPTLSEQEQAIIETAINVDYLVCLADLGI